MEIIRLIYFYNLRRSNAASVGWCFKLMAHEPLLQQQYNIVWVFCTLTTDTIAATITDITCTATVFLYSKSVYATISITIQYCVLNRFMYDCRRKITILYTRFETRVWLVVHHYNMRRSAHFCEIIEFLISYFHARAVLPRKRRYTIEHNNIANRCRQFDW